MQPGGVGAATNTLLWGEMGGGTPLLPGPVHQLTVLALSSVWPALACLVHGGSSFDVGLAGAFPLLAARCLPRGGGQLPDLPSPMLPAASHELGDARLGSCLCVAEANGDVPAPWVGCPPHGAMAGKGQVPPGPADTVAPASRWGLAFSVAGLGALRGLQGLEEREQSSVLGFMATDAHSPCALIHLRKKEDVAAASLESRWQSWKGGSFLTSGCPLAGR